MSTCMIQQFSPRGEHSTRVVCTDLDEGMRGFSPLFASFLQSSASKGRAHERDLGHSPAARHQCRTLSEWSAVTCLLIVCSGGCWSAIRADTKWLHRMDRPPPYILPREGRCWGAANRIARPAGEEEHACVCPGRWHCRSRRLLLRLGRAGSERAALSTESCIRSGVRGCGRRDFAAAPAVSHQVRGRLPTAEGHASVQQTWPTDRHSRGRGADRPGDNEEDVLRPNGWPACRHLAHDPGRVGTE